MFYRLAIRLATNGRSGEHKTLPYTFLLQGDICREDLYARPCNIKESQGKYLPVKNACSIEHLFIQPVGVIACQTPTGGGIKLENLAGNLRRETRRESSQAALQEGDQTWM
jgi:hypothetical protein